MPWRLSLRTVSYAACASCAALRADLEVAAGEERIGVGQPLLALCLIGEDELLRLAVDEIAVRVKVETRRQKQ